MLTQTTESALRALIYLALFGGEDPVSPREIAKHIDASPTYMAKITRMLARADILRSQRGALGGVNLSRDPSEITLLQVVEACQGLIIGNYCKSMSEHELPVCAFHEAMAEMHQSMTDILTRWTVAKLADQTKFRKDHSDPISCKMAFCPPEGCAVHNGVGGPHNGK